MLSLNFIGCSGIQEKTTSATVKKRKVAASWNFSIGGTSEKSLDPNVDKARKLCRANKIIALTSKAQDLHKSEVLTQVYNCYTAVIHKINDELFVEEFERIWVLYQVEPMLEFWEEDQDVGPEAFLSGYKNILKDLDL